MNNPAERMAPEPNNIAREVPPTDPGMRGDRVGPDVLPEHVTPEELAFLIRFFIAQVDRIEGRCVAILKHLGADAVYDPAVDSAEILKRMRENG